MKKCDSKISAIHRLLSKFPQEVGYTSEITVYELLITDESTWTSLNVTSQKVWGPAQ